MYNERAREISKEIMELQGKIQRLRSEYYEIVYNKQEYIGKYIRFGDDVYAFVQDLFVETMKADNRVTYVMVYGNITQFHKNGFENHNDLPLSPGFFASAKELTKEEYEQELKTRKEKFL